MLNGNKIVVSFIDFNKAFDSVDREPWMGLSGNSVSQPSWQTSLEKPKQAQPRNEVHENCPNHSKSRQA